MPASLAGGAPSEGACEDPDDSEGRTDSRLHVTEHEASPAASQAEEAENSVAARRMETRTGSQYGSPAGSQHSPEIQGAQPGGDGPGTRVNEPIGIPNNRASVPHRDDGSTTGTDLERGGNRPHDGNLPLPCGAQATRTQ